MSTKLNKFYNFYKFYKSYIYNHYNRYKGYIRRKGRRYFAYASLAGMALQLVLPLAGLIQPVQANNLIKPTQKGPALFENQSPGFTAEFGDREKPEEHRLRFESKPDLATKGPTFYGYEQEEVPIGQRAKEAVLGAESKGVELRLVEIGESTQAPVEHSLSSEASPSATPEGVADYNLYKNYNGYKDYNNSLASEKLEDLQSQLQDVESGLKEVETGITSVSKDVAEVTKVTKNILEESGVGKPELSVRPSMEETPEDFARTADPASTPPSAYSLPVDTVSQTIDEATKIEYQIVQGRGVKESITLLDKSEIRNPKSETNSNDQNSNDQNSFENSDLENSNIVSPARNASRSEAGGDFDIRASNLQNEFTFELKLDPGVEVRQSIDGLADGDKNYNGYNDYKNYGIIYFVDQFGRYLFHFETPYMVDAAGARSSAVALEIAPLSGASDKNYNGYNDYNDYSQPRAARLTVTADSQWLSAEDRVYPVLIDPSIVHEQSPTFLSGTENRSQTTNAPAVEIQYQELQPDQSTAGLWLLNSDTNISTSVYDSSGNGLHGILTNGAKLTTGGLVGATALTGLTLDGSNDYVQIEDSAALTSDKFSLDLWFKWSGRRGGITDGQDFMALVAKGAFNSGEYTILMDRVDSNSVNNFNFYINGAQRATWQHTQGLETDVWYHLAAVYDGAYASIYLNGAQRVSTAYAASVTNTANQLRIGAQTTGSTYAWDGQIDQVRFSNIARTPDEIAAIASRYPYAVHESPVIDFGSTPNTLDSLNYSAEGVQTGDGETPSTTNGLVGQWNFNETSGTTAYNTGGQQSCGGTASSCNATLTSFADTTGQDVAAGSGWTSANRRWGAGAVMFDGTNDYAIVADNANLDGFTQLTIETWARINKRGSFSGIFAKWNTAGGNAKRQYGLILDTNDEYLRFSISNDGTASSTAKSRTYLELGKWYHLAGTWDGTTLRVYVNGKLDGTATQSTLYETDAPLMFGALGNAAAQVQYLTGAIDGARVYNRQLSSSEIAANAQTGLIEFQTRTGATADPNDGTWEAWKSTSGTGDTQIAANDSGQYDTSDANMVSYWKLDGNATDAKDSNNGTITEATSTNGRFTTAYNFDGSNDVITVTQASNINFTSKTAYTMEAWFKADTDGEADTGQIIQKGAGTFIRVDTQGTDNTLDVEASFDLATTDATLNITDATRTANWTHVALTYEDDADDEITLYINGVNMGSSTNGVGSPATDSNDLLIGGTTTANFDGVIDEVAIWNDARTAAEIAQDAYWAPDLINNAAAGGITTSQDTTTKIEGTASEKLTVGSPQVDSSTVGLWHLEETSGTGAYIKDSTANANHGTPTGTSVVDGFFGKSRDFDGVDDKIDTANDAMSTPTAVTLEAWIKAGTQSAKKRFINVEGAYIFSLQTDNALECVVDANETNFADGSKNVADGNWHYVVCTSDGTTTRLYVDGATDGSTATESIFNIATRNKPIGIGYDVWDGTPFFDGLIDEVRISNVARSAEEIAEAYRAGRDHRLTKTITATDLSAKAKLPFYVAADRPGTYLEATIGESAYANYEPDANTVGLWHLEEQTGSGAYIKDSSGSGNNGTPTGTTFVQGKLGKARSFNGSSDYVDAGNSTSLDLITAFTLEGWINPATLSGYQNMVSKRLAQTSGGNYQIYLNGVAPLGRLSYFDHNNGEKISTYVPAVGVWTHVAATVSGTSLKLYANGAEVYSTTIVAPSTSAGILAIGRAGSYASEYFNGLIDEVRISNIARTADEIRQAYEVGKRTHPVTIDFKSQLDASGLITNSSDYTFSLSSDYEYVSQNLAVGEKIIVRENVGGTEYIAQGTVSAVTYGAGVSNANAPNQALTNAVSTVVTVTSWDGGSTFPTGGFTLMASVFKWQREFFDLTGPLASHINAITFITFRVTDGSQGATVWLDDFNSADYSGGAITGSNSANLAIGSTANRYFQYRAILTVQPFNRSTVSPSLTNVQINYNSGTTPQPPRTKDASSDFSATGATLDRITDTGSSNSPSLELAYKELPKDINTVGLWHMNENAANTCTGGVNDICDASGNTNDGAFNGNAAFTSSGKLGATGTTYDGAGDYASVSDNASLDFAAADNFTVELWAKHNGAISAADYLLTKADATTGGYKLYMDASGDFCFDIDDDATWTPDDTACTSAIDYDDSNWHHVAGVKRGTTDIRLYVDGIEVASDTSIAATATLANTNALYVGIDRDASTGSWDGQIDEVRISNIARTPEEIKLDAQHRPYGVYTSEVQNLGTNVSSIDNLRWTENGVQTGDGETPFSSNGLVAAWNFNETSGTVAVNGAGSGSCGGTPSSCNGTLTNFASTASQDQAAGTGWTANNRRWGAGALMFDGTDDYINAGSTTSLDDLPTGNVTWEAWFTVNWTTDAFKYIISKRPTNLVGYAIGVNPGVSQTYVAIEHSGTTIQQVFANTSFSVGRWYHIAVSFDGASSKIAKLYIDGALIGSSNAASGTYSSEASGNQVIGVTGELSAQYFKGTIDSTRIYSRALSAAEILANYQAGNIELQTRTGTDSTPNDGSGWEDWKPAASQGSEVSLDPSDSLSPVEKISQTGLTAYWKLDETSGTRADSKGTNTLTDNNTVTYAPGRLSNAAQFTAANSEYLSITDNADLSTGNIDFTISAWVYLDSKSAVMNFVKKTDSVTGDEYYLRYIQSSDRFNFGVNSGQVTANTFGSPPTGVWIFLVGWLDSSTGTVYISVNNGSPDSAGSAIGANTAFTFFIGSGNGEGYMNGKIDEVAFWKRTLTAAERTQLFEDGLDLHAAGSGRIYRTRDTATKIEGTASEKLTVGSPQVDSSTVGLWHLEETSSAATDIKDSTSNANNSDAITGTTVVDGFYGKARNFDGTDDVVRVPDATSLKPASAVTLEAWFKPTTLDSTYRVISFKPKGVGGNVSYGIRVNSSNQFEGCINNGGDVCIADTSTLSANRWYHGAITYDGSNVRLYLNGVQVNSSAQTGSIQYDTEQLRVGSNRTSQFFGGVIDELRISSTARTAEEIAEAYRAGRDHRLTKTISSKDLLNSSKLPYYIAADRPGTYLETTIGESSLLNMFGGDTDMKGYWPLDENSTGAAAVTRNDYSGNGNNLTDNATVTSTQGKIGKAGQFTAANSEYLSIADNAALSTGDIDFTVAGWVNLDSTTGNTFKTILSKYMTNCEYYLAYRVATARFRFLTATTDCNTSGAVEANSFGAPSASTWYFVVAWHDSVANTVNIQVNNGTVDSTSYSGGGGDSNESFTIGSLGTNAGYYMDGKIDNVMVLKRVLTADERRQMFEIGRRTHPVTIDFAAKGDAGDLITGSGDTGFTIDGSNASGAYTKGDNLFVGDKVIVRENVSGTEYIAQATVTAVTASTGAVTVASWDSGSTFPTGGYTAAATIFKWQREFMDITDFPPGSSNTPQNPLNSSKDAISRITLRVTDGNEGRTVWLDDFRSAGPYLSVSQTRTSSITSTPQQFFQYRIIFTTTDTAVSPQITQISLQYHSDPGKKVLGADTFLGPPGTGGQGQATLDTAGNMHLGDSNVNDVYFYDRTKDQISYALDFDGSNDYITTANFASQNSVTVEAWAKSSSWPDGNVIFADNAAGLNNGDLKLESQAGKAYFLMSSASSEVAITGTTSLAANQWYHLAATYDGTTMRLYVNGIQEGTNTITANPFANTSTAYIGRNEAGGTYFNGFIDEVAVFNTARTAANITDDYNARRLSDSTSGLVGLWHFDEGSGTRAYDSASTNHGTLTNMTDDDWVNSLSDKDQSALSQQVLGVDPNWPNGPARQSYALDFDGSNEYVSVGNVGPEDLGAGDFTVEAWINTDTTTPQQTILGNLDTVNGSWELLFENGVSRLNFQWYSGGFTSTYGASNTLAANQWHHVAIVRSGTNLQLYIDGKQDAQNGTTTSSVDYTSTSPMEIGRRPYLSGAGSTYFDGKIDEIRISSSARYTANFTPSRRFKEDANTKALWHFDEGIDNTCSGGTNDVCDASSNADDGAKTNMEEADYVTDARAVMDNNARYVSLGSSSAVNTDRGMELKITSTTAFQYRWTGDQTWTTPATSTLSSYSFSSPSQIDSTGVYVGFDTTNGTFGDESYFLIPSWALEQFSSSDTNNAMRGTKRGFPERSYLIATDKGVDILDADDNTLWMRAEQGSGRSLGADFNNDPSAIFMSHGQLLVATNGSAGTGLYRYDFNRDKIYRYDATDRRTNTVNIAKRNTSDSSYGSADTSFALVNSTVNDVHAAVSEGKLYIATATDAGLDVIQASQTNTYSFSDVAGDDYNAVWMASYGDLFGVNETQAQVEKWSIADDNAADELAGAPDMTWDEASTPALSTAAPTVQTTPDQLVVTGGTSTIDSSSATIYYGHGAGVTQVNTKGGDENNGSVKYLTKDYISEELIGDTNGFWPLNETSGTRTDQSVKTNDLTDNNTVTYASGVRGTAAQFTRANSEYLSIADNASLSVGDIDFTISAWAYLDSVTDFGIVAKDTGAVRGYAIGTSNPGTGYKFFFQVGSDASTFTSLVANSFGTISTGTWYFIVAWHDSVANTMNIQVNNGTVDSTAYALGGYDEAQSFKIGSHFGENYFNGRIDEVLFTKEVLTAAQRTQLYVSGREALNNKYRATLASDTVNQLAGSINVVKGVAVAKLNQTGVTRGEYLYVGTNGTSADDGSLSRILVNGDTRDREYDESTKEPYLLTDNDINSVSISNDGAYIVVGTDDQGITIIQNGSNTVRLRGGSKIQGPYKRPHN